MLSLERPNFQTMLDGALHAGAIFPLELSLRKAPGDIALIAGSRLDANQAHALLTHALAADNYNLDYTRALNRIGVASPASHFDLTPGGTKRQQ